MSTVLGSVADVFNGKTPSKADQRKSGHPVFKVKDALQDGRFVGCFSSYVDKNYASRHTPKFLKDGDTLILNAAHNAAYVASKIFYADKLVEGALATGEWLIVRPNATVALPRYIYFWLQSSEVRARIKFIVKGIHLYPKDVAQLPIQLPPLSEQRRVIDILDRAEAIARLRAQARAKANEIVPALFVNMFGDPATNSKRWRSRPFTELVTTVSGGTPSKKRPDFWVGDIPWVSPKDMKRTLISDAQDHINESVFKETNLKVIPPLSVLIVVRGMILVHSVPVAMTMVPVAINQDMKAFIPNEEVNADYVCWSLKVLHSKLLEKVTTAAHGTKKLDAKVFEKLLLPVPPLSKQDDFSRAISAVIGISDYATAAHSLSSQLEKSLLSSEI